MKNVNYWAYLLTGIVAINAIQIASAQENTTVNTLSIPHSTINDLNKQIDRFYASESAKKINRDFLSKLSQEQEDMLNQLHILNQKKLESPYDELTRGKWANLFSKIVELGIVCSDVNWVSQTLTELDNYKQKYHQKFTDFKTAAEKVYGLAAKIPFEREYLIMNNGSAFVEGYWATSPNIHEDNYSGRYPFPKSNTQAWIGKEEFLSKLKQVEALGLQGLTNKNKENGRIRMTCYNGTAYSRLDGSAVGACEYQDSVTGIMWPWGYSDHYIEKYNVIPSREFYCYVMAFPIDELKK